MNSSPQTRHRIHVTYQLFQTTGYLDQQFVAHIVPQGVIDTLEIVQIQEHQGTKLLAAFGGGNGEL